MAVYIQGSRRVIWPLYMVLGGSYGPVHGPTWTLVGRAVHGPHPGMTHRTSVPGCVLGVRREQVSKPDGVLKYRVSLV